jgi:hypothetical protein
MENDKAVEIIALGEFDSETKRRDFDAISYGKFYWRGRLDFVLRDAVEGEIYVYSDRSNMLAEDYGVRPGTINEVENNDRAKQIITKAVEQCFDHTTSVEVIGDGDGGWIPLGTDN